MRNIDFSSWQSVLATLFGLTLVTLIGVGVRLLTMMTIQQRRERTNRQINERLKALIAAYKVLGGSFTGDLTVDPTHLRDLRRRGDVPSSGEIAVEIGSVVGETERGDRSRRTRDAVEAALSDIILLGTEAQVRLADIAVRELLAGRPVHTQALVVALRDFIREALDLDPIPSDLTMPPQGPTRTSNSGGRGKSERKDAAGQDGVGKGGGGTGGGMGGGMGMGGGTNLGGGAEDMTSFDRS